MYIHRENTEGLSPAFIFLEKEAFFFLRRPSFFPFQRRRAPKTLFLLTLFHSNNFYLSTAWVRERKRHIFKFTEQKETCRFYVLYTYIHTCIGTYIYLRNTLLCERDAPKTIFFIGGCYYIDLTSCFHFFSFSTYIM